MAVDLRPEASEALGVFFLVLAGGTAILTGASPLSVSLVFGSVILVLVYALGHIGGAHFNPAITLAFAATRHFPWRRVPSYWVAQLGGATAAAWLLSRHFEQTDSLVTRLHVPAPTGFVVEALATFLLAMVIIGVATDRRAAPGAAGLAIGLVVGVGAIAAGPLTGASMNPARSLGPALVAGAWSHWWLYLLAPTVGAVAAMFTYEALRKGSTSRSAEPLGALGSFRLPGGKAP